MTAGQFLNIKLLHECFGKVRIRETGVRLREAYLFDKGWKNVDPIAAATFLFSLFASPAKNATKYAALTAAKSGEIISGKQKNDRTIRAYIAKLLYDKESRDQVDYLTVSQKDGSTKVYFKDRNKPEEWFNSNDSGIDYDGFNFNEVDIDVLTYVGWRFFEQLAETLNYQK